MGKILYSLNDMYPFSSPVSNTTEQTLPSDDEAESYNEQTTVIDNKKVIINKKMVMGALGLLVGVMVAVHYLGGE